MPTTTDYNWTAELPAGQAIELLEADFVAPVEPGYSDLIRTTDGRCYLHEFNRWGADPVVRELPRDYVDFPLLQDYPFPAEPGDVEPPADCSGVISC